MISIHNTQACRTDANKVYTKPLADVFEGKDGFLVRLDVPGVVTSDVNVQLERGELVVEATRWLAPAQEGAERPARTYRRTFTVPESVDPQRITASLDKGVLTVSLGKRAEATVRSIPIQ